MNFTINFIYVYNILTIFTLEYIIMKEIRLCDNMLLTDTINNCIKYNIWIEVQQFHNLLAKQWENEIEAEERLNKEMKFVKDSLNQFPCGKSLYGPFREMNVGSKVPEIVNAAEKYYNKVYNIASYLWCTEIVLHNGYVPWTSSEIKWAENAIKFRKNFLENKKWITICLKNLLELNSGVLIKVIDGVNDQRIKACLDIWHAYSNSNMNINNWIETLWDRIAYYHLHTNHGKQNVSQHDDEHLGLKSGTIDIVDVLKCSERFSPSAIRALESRNKYHIEDLEMLKSLGYLS